MPMFTRDFKLSPEYEALFKKLSPLLEFGGTDDGKMFVEYCGRRFESDKCAEIFDWAYKRCRPFRSGDIVRLTWSSDRWKVWEQRNDDVMCFQNDYNGKSIVSVFKAANLEHA